MDITILICAIALILAAILVIWQAKALARCDLICKSCGTKQNLPWKWLVFRTHVEMTGSCIVRSAGANVVYRTKEGTVMGFQQSFKALSDPVRREILSLLRRGPMAAGDIAAHFEVSGATISHHLSVLRDAGLVLDDKQGKYIYYELNMSVVDEILEWISALKGDGRMKKIQ